MSKYNLIDIYEQYKIGSGWTKDFDYDGMLKTGLATSIDTPIEVLKKISDDFEDVNYHRENHHLQDAIDAIEIGDMVEAEGRLSNFHAEIRKTQEEQGMDIEPTVGKFMASKMEEEMAVFSSEEDEDKYIEKMTKKTLEKEKERAAKKKKGVEEVTSREGSRIEGLLSIPLKSKFLNAFEELYFDLVEEDPFHAEDVIEHLGIEMLKHLDAIQAQGDRLAGLEEDAIEDEPVTEYGSTMFGPFEFLKSKGIGEEMILAFLKVHAQDVIGASEDEIMDEFENFRSVNYDYIDENLKEHFGRFMKDYQ